MKLVSKCLLISFFSVSSANALFAKKIVPQDYEILADFYKSTNGTKWMKNDGWLSTDSNAWHGVTLNERGRVVELNLDSNNLTGSLTSALGNLSELQVLNLYDNKLTGNIPSSFGNLSNLRVLRLTQNNLTGSIPSSLGNLSKLQRLHLTNNQLTGSIPPSLSNLSNLGELTLNNNRLTDSIPSCLGNFSKLYKLLLSNNQLTGSIPSSLGNLSYLWVLNLSNNQLTGSIPSSLGNLVKLQKLYLTNNQLTGPIPSSFVNLFKPSLLIVLDLGYNQLSGKIPSSFESLPDKVKAKLYLDHNRFTFAGLEILVQKKFDTLSYIPQAKISIHKKYSNGIFYSVSAGGTPGNNSYKWFKNGEYITTIASDSTFHFKGDDTALDKVKLSVEITNSVVKDLILNSNIALIDPKR